VQATKLLKYSLNSVQAAMYLDMSVGHLYNLIARHRGPRHVKYGGQLRFSRADLDGWIARRCRVIDSDRRPQE